MASEKRIVATFTEEESGRDWEGIMNMQTWNKLYIF
jgi:hypothetical protein